MQINGITHESYHKRIEAGKIIKGNTKNKTDRYFFDVIHSLNHHFSSQYSSKAPNERYLYKFSFSEILIIHEYKRLPKKAFSYSGTSHQIFLSFLITTLQSLVSHSIFTIFSTNHLYTNENKSLA
jgi:hypothetical protein